MSLREQDHELLHIIDSSFEDAARRSGPSLVCRPGCAACCYAPFPITPLDAWRLRLGPAELSSSDPHKAAGVKARVSAYIQSLPDDPLAEDDDSLDNLPCPALDPQSLTCDLYPFRPIQCRIFGPPIQSPQHVAVNVHHCMGGRYETLTDPRHR